MVAETVNGTQPRLSVVVPTRNEAGNIAPLVSRLDAALSGLDYEIVFVDDSTDDTPQAIAGLTEHAGSHVRLIHRPVDQRNGLSGAVVEGIVAAHADWVCVMDADLQHPPENVRLLLDQASRTGADLVVASRRADFTGPMGLSRGRAMTSQALTILARGLFPRVLKNVSDPLTGFFLVNKSALDLGTLRPDGFKILLEILVRHPQLHVSEIFFDFARRNDGQSKADLNEGIRYFRHVTRLRWSVNHHLARFLLVIVLAVIINLLLLTTLVGRLYLSLLTGALVAGAVTLLGLLLGEAWVFSERPPSASRRRLLLTLLLGTAYLLVIYLPMLAIMTRLGVPYLLAALLALSVAGFVYYLFSEYWIWTRGLMMRPRSENFYSIHGILTIASQVPLIELSHFEIESEPQPIDLQLRVDRHGTPSLPAGAIVYDEHLGRFGFSLAVQAGDYSEVVVSPMLESSPSFLYTNVVEPVLHWMVVTRGYAFLPVAAVAASAPGPDNSGAITGSEGLAPALLFSGTADMAYGLMQLASNAELSFMGDDRIILDENGRVYAFPKPVTVNQSMLDQASAATRAVAPLALQRLVYSRRIRELGIWIGARRLPAATLNSYLQRLIPQPKYAMAELAPHFETVNQARAARLILFEAPSTPRPDSLGARIDDLVARGWMSASAGFQPLAELSSELSTWDGIDWIAAEQQISRKGLQFADVQTRPGAAANWWEQVATEPRPTSGPRPTVPATLTAPQT